jgi:Dehydrogenases with different specificities (related to short-chain alcohol dehydrogenases)
MINRSLFDLKNKVAVVVGGAGLIGNEIVKGLSDFSAKVYVADAAKKAAGRIKVKGVKFLHMDIASEDSIREALGKVCDEAARIDILINCAYPRTSDWGLKLEDVPFDSWKDNVNSHLGGYFLCAKLAADLMKKKKNGVIINFASIYGIVAPDFSIYQGTKMTMPVAYSAIKGGIISLTKYLATYYAKYNIRANTISPGGVFNGQAGAFVKKYAKRTPLNRMASPKDIVGAVIFLSSDASSYVTGQNLIVDGGWSAW